MTFLLSYKHSPLLCAGQASLAAKAKQRDGARAMGWKTDSPVLFELRQSDGVLKF